MPYKIPVRALPSRPLFSVITSPNARRKCRFLQFLIPPRLAMSRHCNERALDALPVTCSSVSTVSELRIGSAVQPPSSPRRVYRLQTTPSISCSTFPRENTAPGVDCDVPSGQNSAARFEISTVTNESSLSTLSVSRFHSFSVLLVCSDYHLPRP